MSKTTRPIAAKKSVPSKKAAPAKKVPCLPWHPKIGQLVRVPNINRVFGSADSYQVTLLRNDNGEEFYAALTDGELNTIRQRAMKNPEDLIRLGRKRNLF